MSIIIVLFALYVGFDIIKSHFEIKRLEKEFETKHELFMKIIRQQDLSSLERVLDDHHHSN